MDKGKLIKLIDIKMNKIIINNPGKREIKIMKKVLLSQSHIINPSSQNPKQSRLYVKQQEIRRKVSKIQTHEELQKVYNVMKNQNIQLIKDVTVLKQHLAQVEDKKKMQASRISVKNQSFVSAIIANEIDLSQYSPELVLVFQKHKKQLQEQYKLMRYLKQTISEIKKQNPTEEVTEYQQNKKNKLKQLETQILNEKKKQKLLLKQGEQLEQTIKQNELKDNTNAGSIENYEKQNNELRKRILQFKQEGYKSQLKAAQVIDQIYKKKEIITQYQEKAKPNLFNSKLVMEDSASRGFFNRSKSVSNNLSKQATNYQTNQPKLPQAITSISSHSINNTDLTQKQVTSLKQQVHQLSLQQLKRKQQQKKQKDEMIENTKKMNQKFKELQKLKTKKVVELNHLKAKIKNIIREKQLKEKMKVYTLNSAIQQDGFQLESFGEPLRRDFAGILGQKVRFDDRMFLKDNKRAFFKGLIVYENDNNLSAKGSIAAVRAIYTDQEANFQNYTPLPGQYLQKCKTQRLQLPEDDFIKLIKVKYNTQEARVTKIEIRSNRNLKYEFGEKKSFQEVSQHETVYAFDIGLNEFPVSMFGSFCQFRNCWFLECFGVEINTLS